MTIRSILFVLFFLPVFLSKAGEILQVKNGKQHFHGIRTIIQRPETDLSIKPPGYREQILSENNVRDTFVFVNNGKVPLTIKAISSEEELSFSYTKTIAPGDKGFVFYSRQFGTYGQGVTYFDIHFSIETDIGNFNGFIINYLVIHPNGLNYLYDKGKVNGYKIKLNSGVEIKVDIDSIGKIKEYGFYHFQMNRKIGSWRIFKNNKPVGMYFHPKCLPIVVFEKDLKNCDEFDLKVHLDSGYEKTPLFYKNGNRVDVLVEPHVNKITIRRGILYDSCVIKYLKLTDWRPYAMAVELLSDKDWERIERTKRGELKLANERFVFLLDMPYWSEEETQKAIKDYGLEVIYKTNGRILFSDKKISDRLENNSTEDWKVRAICQAYDSNLYLNDRICVKNLDSSRMYELDTMMLHNGFVRLFVVPYGYTVYKHVGKLLDEAYYRKCLTLMGRVPDIDLYILPDEVEIKPTN